MQTAELSIIGQFRNLTTFSLISALYMESEELLQLKSLYNLEHLHLDCCGEDCDASPEAIAEFFRLPSESASNFFPYRLKYLRMSDCHPFYFEAAQELVKSCPQLESLNVAWNQFMGEEALSLFIKNLSNLRFLNIGGLGEMKCEALCEISDDELPKLRFLSLHNTKVSEEILQRINLRRPNLFITNRSDYFINWGMRNGELHFNKEFRGDINAVLNDLAEIDGFCCMHSVI
ncbi:unnamed protein product [Toxocara canis]|uniref:Leucine Rich repeat-containing domain protein n=1 Tax=Toxocara canis TaxID=6265 RepID=A0A183UVV5_TOXCA|nr:unnamed protein product [Toxocara canis]